MRRYRRLGLSAVAHNSEHLRLIVCGRQILQGLLLGVLGVARRDANRLLCDLQGRCVRLMWRCVLRYQVLVANVWKLEEAVGCA